MQNVIIGAGFTGMAAGIKTGWPIYEATDHAGGICRSYQKDGFEFSTGGGHWIFGEGPGLDYIKNLVEVNTYERRASVYFNTSFPYPFQTTALAPCMAMPGTLKNWLIDKFRPELFNLFFGPFNAKYTAGMYEKVVQVDDYKSPPAGGKGFCSRFYDPVGGLDVLIGKMSGKCLISHKKAIVGVDLNRNLLHLEDGDRLHYKKIISTIPLNRMVAMCGRKAELPYTSALVINIGAVPGKLFPTDHWVYVPFCRSGFYRVGFYSNIDPSKAPAGKAGISVEMAFLPQDKPNALQLEKICFDVINELQEWGWIGEVITLDPTWVQTAYTWLFNKNDAAREVEWLRQKGIFSIGRYGSWKFCGMKESIEMGMSV